MNILASAAQAESKMQQRSAEVRENRQRYSNQCNICKEPQRSKQPGTIKQRSISKPGNTGPICRVFGELQRKQSRDTHSSHTKMAVRQFQNSFA